MTAPSLKKPIATCRSKRRHPDELTARAVAMHAIEQRKEVRRLYVYHCRECNGWHLTRSYNGIGNLVTADNPVHGKQGSPA